MALKRSKKHAEFKRLRELAGLTLPEAMNLLKVELRTAYRYEQGETKPSKLALDILRQERAIPADYDPMKLVDFSLLPGNR